MVGVHIGATCDGEFATENRRSDQSHDILITCGVFGFVAMAVAITDKFNVGRASTGTDDQKTMFGMGIHGRRPRGFARRHPFGFTGPVVVIL